MSSGDRPKWMIGIPVNSYYFFFLKHGAGELLGKPWGCMSGASFTYFCENTCFEAVCCVLGEHAEKELSDPVTEECFKFKKKAVGHLSWS